jgi:hypothetical protein
LPVAFDANLGSIAADKSGITSGTISQVLTTSAAAASNTRIVVAISYWANNPATPLRVGTVNDGSAYTRDVQFVNADGQDVFEIWSRQAAAGLASSSSITVTMTPTATVTQFMGGLLIGAASFLGVTGVDTTATASNTGTTWASGSATNAVADAVFFGGSGNETAAAATNTMSSGTEIHDARNTTAQQGFATGYILATTSASANIAGTWTSTSTANTGALVIYSGTVAASLPEVVMAPRIPTY